jgi:LmbE family N-acetylglucosaminyl deacetylase
MLFSSAVLVQNRPLRIIAFGAHPDDCDLGAGGIAAKYAMLGHKVKFVSLTNGDVGHQSEPREELDRVLRALNAIRKPSSAEEIAELLNRDLDLNERPFQEREIEAWLRNSSHKVARLYWLETRPRR